MKNTFKVCLLAFGAMLSSISAKAISMFGHNFVFKGATTEWSEPLTDELHTDYMKKHNQAAIPISVRVRVVRKIFRGCRYEVEVTNKDASRKLTYTMEGQGQKLKKHKLKAGETDSYEADTLLSKNCPDVDGCGNGTCEYDLAFHDVDVDG